MAQSLMNAATGSPGGSRNAPRSREDALFERDLVALIPHLQSFSRQLCGRNGIADDMAQDALAKAWCARDSFEPGTNLKAWVFRILRHTFYSHMRRAWRQSHWDEHKGDQIPAPPDEQQWSMDLSDCMRGLSALRKPQRDALLLVGAAGLSYGDASKVLDVAIGSVKSRAARARGKLARMLDGQEAMPDKRPPVPPGSALEDILAQLSMLKPVGANAEWDVPAGSNPR